MRYLQDGKGRIISSFPSYLLQRQLFCWQASGLDHVPVPEEKGNAPQAAGTHQRIHNAAEHGPLATENVGNQVKLENADQAPVDGPHDGKQQGDFIGNHVEPLLVDFTDSIGGSTKKYA